MRQLSWQSTVRPEADLRSTGCGSVLPRTGHEERTMVAKDWVVVGLDNGGTANNATVLDRDGTFLVDGLVEVPSRVLEGPDIAVEALAGALDNILAVTKVD